MSILFLKYIGILYKKESCFYFNLHKIQGKSQGQTYNVISVNMFVLFYAT